jgi:preprotein translocase subunit SecG
MNYKDKSTSWIIATLTVPADIIAVIIAFYFLMHAGKSIDLGSSVGDFIIATAVASTAFGLITLVVLALSAKRAKQLGQLPSNALLLVFTVSVSYSR